VRTGARNFALGANLGSLRFGANLTDAYRYWNACLFLRDSMKGRGLPATSVKDAFSEFSSNQEVCFPASNATWSWADPSYLADLVHLSFLCKAIRPRTIFEIGTSTGYSSLFLAANSPQGARVWTLDLPSQGNFAAERPLTWMDKKIVAECHRREPCFVKQGAEYQIQKLQGDSATFDFSPYWKKIDLFFVDGAHTYDYVKSDSIHALRCCHRGSVIAWHDYGRAGLSRDVTVWLNELGKLMPVHSTPGSSVAFASFGEEGERLVSKFDDRGQKVNS
jgi:hypothetical protein